MAIHPGLVSPPEDRLAIEQVRRTLATERVGFQTYLFEEVGSTNTVLRRIADSGAPDGTVVLAETQSMGRGRLGKPWFSPPGLNLYASVLFRPPIAPSTVPVFSFISSLALTDAIWAEGLPAAIKWPNDVLVDGRKVAGTLAAYASAGDVVEYVILGVGVNLNVDRPALAGALGPAAAAATSLREAAGRRIDRNAFAAAFLNLLEKWDDEHRAHGGDALLAAWRERDALANHAVEIRVPGETYRARAIGVNSAGRLIVEDAAGERREIVTGEIVIVG
jgi:BirA family transcriptional regulator, biotin operon repressor / biotin---[acetyl-CoA-carboxylase] ligase